MKPLTTEITGGVEKKLESLLTSSKSINHIRVLDFGVTNNKEATFYQMFESVQADGLLIDYCFVQKATFYYELIEWKGNKLFDNVVSVERSGLFNYRPYESKVIPRLDNKYNEQLNNLVNKLGISGDLVPLQWDCFDDDSIISKYYLVPYDEVIDAFTNKTYFNKKPEMKLHLQIKLNEDNVLSV